jgi:uncharacterized protein YdeI (YjbR/CyaY-like superfamily)
MKKTVEEYIEYKSDWEASLNLLRTICLSTKMKEGMKWENPAYLYNGKNIVGLAAFKSYVGIWFHQGVFLKDVQKKLENAQEKTVAMRQWRFQNVDEIEKDRELILHYLEEAILNQELGKEVKPNRKKPVIIPEELTEKMASNASLKSSFEALTVFKQREYADYISEAKRLETKENRLEKIGAMIQKGIGLYEKYKE